MKTEEDEAFEDIERRQGGFQAKRQMAADKLYHPTEARWCENFVEVKHPHIDNEIVRFYFTQPAQSMKVEGPLHVVCQCDKCKVQPVQEQRQPLTDEQADRLLQAVGILGSLKTLREIVRAVETAHGIKE